VTVPEPEVDQDDVARGAVDFGESVGDGLGEDGLDAGAAQSPVEGFADGWIVFDDQHVLHIGIVR